MQEELDQLIIKWSSEMEKICFALCLIVTIGLAPVSFAETLEPISDNSVGSVTGSTTIPSDNPQPTVETKKKYHLEIGGSYSSLDNNYGQWKSIDLKVTYSGFKKITPSFSMARLTRKEGSQLIYGFGSYINVSPKFYMAAGVSGAPVNDPKVILYPRLRFDVGGFFVAPMVKGLVVTTGITHFPKQNGGGGDIISVGGIYYGKIIFQGSLSYNIARPGNITSLSGSAGFMYGVQGKYWFGGGTSIGRVAYQLATKIPLDVRYKSRSASLFYNKWIGKTWGINTRIEFASLVGAYNLKGITAGLFFDF